MILFYYLFNGLYPGSRLVLELPPLDNGLDGNQAKFMFFYASWCPWCKKADDKWRSFKQLVNNQGLTYGGHHISFEEINAEIDKSKSALYGVKAYPTFKVETKDKMYEMKGTPSVITFREFLKKALGDEKATQSTT